MVNYVSKLKSFKRSIQNKFGFRVSGFKFPREARRGFTIAEMLTVTLVMGILFSIGSRVYYEERDRFVYNDALTQMIGLIKTARNAATTSRAAYADTDPDPAVETMENIVPPSGYGVFINLIPNDDEPHFTLFASLGIGADGKTEILNENFDHGELDPNTDDDIPDEIIEEFRLPKKMQFEYLLFDKPGDPQGLEPMINTSDPPEITADSVAIFFRPPLGDMYMEGWLEDTRHDNLEEVGLKLFNPSMPEGSPRRCQYIRINRIKAFPIIEYSDCTTDPGAVTP